ncbi:MAG: Hsp70 family protein, partial [Myxococcota bacterium]
MSDTVIGIDLGTTNSVVALARGTKLDIIEVDDQPLLPSVVGFDPEDALLVGHVARNQYLARPERTVTSIKRKMGEDAEVLLGDHQLTPVEVSALILRKLKLAVAQA